MKVPKKAAQSFLPASSLVAERIAEVYPELSDALRAFADFVMNEPMKVAQMSINDTVNASGVSVATANRFARKLGFEGYAQFRSEVIAGFEAMFEPVERLRRTISAGSKVHDIVAASIHEDIDNLGETLRDLDVARVEQAVELLCKARRIFGLAFDNAAALANIFAHRMTLAGRDVRVVDGGGGRLSAARFLASYGPQDLVVAIAFPRYMRDTIEMARAVQQRGIPLLAITDNQSSPLASLGVLTIYVRATRTIGATSDAAILAVLEALAAGVSFKAPEATDTGRRFTDFAYPWLIAPDKRDH